MSMLSTLTNVLGVRAVRAAAMGVTTAVTLSVAGCSMFVSHEEVALYRRIRTTTDSNQRLVAMAEYARDYGSGGAWISNVRAEREANEGQIWATNNASPDGLAFYLQAYPDGTYVEQARARQTALAQVSTGREETQQREQELAQQTAASQAEERRQWVTRASQFWMRTLVGVRNYGSPIAQVARVNPEFSRAFGAAPAPQCTPTRCLKHYHAHYAVPVPGGNRIEREMHLVLRVGLEEGRVERIEVLMPNHGFSRWFELENRTIVLDEDPEARMAAIEWALQRIEPTLAEVATGSRAIDFIPEPVTPVGESSPIESDEADTTTSMDGSSDGAAPAPAPAGDAAPSEGGEGDATLEQLMTGAVGGEQQTTEQSTEQTTEEQQTVVYPLGLRALQRGTTRIVIFAAGDGDYGDAYDGFFVERVRDGQ
jgi:hypothetical protein